MLQPRNLCIDPISQISSNKESTFSVEMFIDELKKEMEANKQAQIEFIESQFDYTRKLLLPQLTFEVSCLFKTLNDDSFLYKTVSLNSSNKD